MRSASINTCRKRAASVVLSAPENRAMVLFQQAIAYRKGLILLETDRGSGTGRVTSSYSSVRLAMPMSHHSLSAKAAIPF